MVNEPTGAGRSEATPDDVMTLLQAVSGGDRAAFDRLFALVYPQIRALARRRMAEIDNFSRVVRLRGDLVAELTSTDSSGSQAQFGISVDFDGVRSVVGAHLFPDQGPEANRYGAIFSFTNPTVLACRDNFDAIFCNGFEN